MARKGRPRIRAAVLAGYPELARAVHLDPAKLLRTVSLSGHVLLDPDMKVPVASVVRLFELSSERAGVENFGLRLSERSGVASLGAVSLLAREQATLREALYCYLRYMRLHNEALAMHLEESAGEARITLALELGDSVPMRQSIEFAIGAALRVVRALVGAPWRARLVCFRHGAPRDTRSYQSILDAPLRFHAAFDGFFFDARDLERKLAGANPELAAYAERYLKSVALADGGLDVKAQVERAITHLLPTGLCSAERVARHVGLSRRTVHRHLQELGSTFLALVDSHRDRLVLGYLRERERSFGEVAQLLGFSSLSAFSRWFKARNGYSPSAGQVRAGAKARIASSTLR